jgi:hypothetical protein
MGCRRGQIWVETVIYTLIGLAIIGIVLAVAKPKIDAKKDEIWIEQAFESLGKIDEKIFDVQAAAGNKRIVDLKIGKGALLIDVEHNKISWEIDSSFAYSEVRTPVSVGNVDVTTTGVGPYKVSLAIDYDVDIRFEGLSSGVKKLDSAPTPYRLSIENSGRNSGGSIIVLFKEV